MFGLIVEMFVIGLIAGVFTYTIALIYQLITKGKVEVFPSHWFGMFFVVFLSIALLHFIFEITGVNHWYCRHKKKYF